MQHSSRRRWLWALGLLVCVGTGIRCSTTSESHGDDAASPPSAHLEWPPGMAARLEGGSVEEFEALMDYLDRRGPLDDANAAVVRRMLADWPVGARRVSARCETWLEDGANAEAGRS